jgi:hypothetical protein
MEFYKVSEKGKEKIVTKHTKAEMFSTHNARATSITLDAEAGVLSFTRIAIHKKCNSYERK